MVRTLISIGECDINLANHHVVMLANVYRVSEPAVESLERFVRRGGGLIAFLGDQVDPDLYNAALYRGGEGLLPGELSQQVRAPTRFQRTQTTEQEPEGLVSQLSRIFSRKNLRTSR